MRRAEAINNNAAVLPARSEQDPPLINPPYGMVPVANLICSYRVENHLFYRFRTAFHVLDVIRQWYESCVRLVSPCDLVCSRPCEGSAFVLVVFVLYSASSLYRFVIFRLISSKIYLRDSYENLYSFFSVISFKLISNDLFRIIRGTTVLCRVQ